VNALHIGKPSSYPVLTGTYNYILDLDVNILKQYTVVPGTTSLSYSLGGITHH